MSTVDPETERDGGGTGQSKPQVLHGRLVICDDWHQCLVVQELMACCARTFGFEDFAIRKAVKEALANALKHGNGSAPDKCIRIDYEMTETEFRVVIADEGCGFDHAAPGLAGMNSRQLPGHGLGLMQHYMTAVRFNDAGNCVELSKRKSSS